MHFNWSQNLFGMDGQAYPPLHPWMCGLLSPGEGKVGTPLREVAKRMIFGGQQTACTTPCPNLCFLGIPQTSFSIKFKRELCHIYPDCTQQIDSMLKTQTNKQTDVYGRTEWQSPTSLDFVLCVVIWMGCWVVNLFSTINREHSICTL